MHPVTITLNFPSVADAAEALNRLGGGARSATIAPADHPSAGTIPVIPVPLSLVPSVEPNPFAQPAGTVTPIVAAAPVIPPAPVVASATTPAPAATVGVPPVGVELDAKGLPWDGRIHGATKTKNADLSWRSKRNLDDAVRIAVEAELRSGQAARVPPAAVITAAAAAVGLPVAAVVPPPPAAVITPPPVAETFGTLMARLAPQMQVPARLAVINEVLAEFKVGSLAGLAGRPDLVTPFSQYIDAKLATVPA